MARTITIELSDEQYAALEARAKETGTTVEAVAEAGVIANGVSPAQPLDDAEAKKARGLAALRRMGEMAARQPRMTSEEFEDFLEECRRDRDERPYGPRDLL